MAINQPAADKERETMEVVKTSRPAPGVFMIELSDPPANTYTHQMFRQFDNAVLEARFDDEISVIFVTGEGEKFFCAGANIGMLEESNPHWKYFFCLHANETLSRLEQTPKLVVAGLNGHTVGGGLEIAMAADIRIARRDAGRCGLPEVNLGVLPGTGGTQRLLRIVGKSKVIELMCTGNLFSFEEAEEWGIVNDIYDGDAASFREQMIDYCKQFTLPNKATKVVGNIKRCVQSGAEMSFESGLTLERRIAKGAVRQPRRKRRPQRVQQQTHAELQGRLNAARRVNRERVGIAHPFRVDSNACQLDRVRGSDRQPACLTHPKTTRRFSSSTTTPAHAEITAEVLTRVGYSVDTAHTGEDGLRMAGVGDYDTVLCDLKLPDIDGMEVLKRLKAHDADIEVVIVTGYASVEKAVDALQTGAYSFLEKPVNRDALRNTIAKAVERRNLSLTNRRLSQLVNEKFGYEGIIGNSAPMREVFNRLKQVAPTDARVLITGSNGQRQRAGGACVALQ